MRRRQATYARRRNRARRPAPAPASSPLQSPADPAQEQSRTEMAYRMRKRSRRSGSEPPADRAACGRASQEHGAKKTKVVLGGKLGAGPLLALAQTPHATSLTESQRFRLGSSRGSPVPPGFQFSPLPAMRPREDFLVPIAGPGPYLLKENPARKTSHLAKKISSSNLKENNVPHSASAVACGPIVPGARQSSGHRNQAAKLASPFASQPTTPDAPAKAQYPNNATKRNMIAAMKKKQVLSDTHYNPNLPTRHHAAKVLSHSTVSSPSGAQAAAAAAKSRRPSAPSATAHRPDTSSWFAPEAPGSAHVPFSPLVGCAVDVDFNRPPSQLAYTSAYEDDFFCDALGASTPFGATRLPSLALRAGTDSLESTDSEDDGGCSRQFGEARCRTLDWLPRCCLNTHPGSGQALGAPCLEHTTSTWLSDSLISPPKELRECAYRPPLMNPPDVMTDADVTMNTEEGDNDDTTSLGRQGESLKDLLENLELGPGGVFDSLLINGSIEHLRPKPSGTRSLDAKRSEASVLDSPVHISPSKVSCGNAGHEVLGRNRRGTLRASDFQGKAAAVSLGLSINGSSARRTRSGTVVGPTGSRRERSGTVVARPVGLIKSTDYPIGAEDTDMQEMENTSAQQGNGDGNTPEEEMEDELLLKSIWKDEEWVVAEPPSPIVTRRSGMIKGWTKEQEKKAIRANRQKALGNMHAKGKIGYDEDDGEDDPLSLLN